MGVLEKAVQRVAIPAEALGQCRILISGDGYVSIENHKGLLEYSESCITLSRRGGIIKVQGENLSISAMDREGMVIKGKILALNLE